MADSESVSQRIEQLKAGDSQAAQWLWERYYRRLAALARKKLGEMPRRASDEEDVVQSAFKSFCLRAQNGQFPDLHDRDDLWCLLAVISARKAANHRHHERRLKRGGGRVGGESVFDGDSREHGIAQVIAEEPSAEDAAEFTEQLAAFMDSLDDPTHRVIALWKFEGRTNPEIARHLDCSLSAVERKLRMIRRRLTPLSGPENSSD